MPPKRVSLNTIIKKSNPSIRTSTEPLSDILAHIPKKRRSGNYGSQASEFSMHTSLEPDTSAVRANSTSMQNEVCRFPMELMYDANFQPQIEANAEITAHATSVQNELHASPLEPMNDQDFQPEINDANTPHKKKRRTRGRITLKGVAPKNGEKHICYVVSCGSVVGPGRRKLSNTLGIFARNTSLFPIYKEWGEEHESAVSRVMIELRPDFKFINLDNIEVFDSNDVITFVKTTINQQIRDFRSWLKGLLSPDIPIHEQIESLDDRVSDGSWQKLIEYWSADIKMLEASRNKLNRSALQATHTSGPLSFAERQYIAEEKGEEVTLLDNYLNGHKMKNGEYPNEKTKECCEKVAQRSRDLGLEKTKDKLKFISVLDDAYGSHHGGYERGISGGITRRELKRKALANETNVVVNKAWKSQLQEKDRQIEEKDRELEELRAQLKLFQSQGNATSSNSGHLVQIPFNVDEETVPSTLCHVRRLSTHYGTSGQRVRAFGPNGSS